MEAKVIGIGGIFIKFKDPDAMREWYKVALGLTTNDYGVLFAYNTIADHTAYLQLGTFPASSEYFGSEKQQVMINFRVNDLEQLLIKLKALHVEILDTLETYEYGKFIHIADPEGNRIELWEAIDDAFTTEPTTQML